MAWDERRASMMAAPVRVTGQMAVMCEWIDTQFSQPRAASTEQMESLRHLWERVITTGDKPTVLVVCTGERLRQQGSKEASDRTPRADRRWTFAIIRGHGFRDLMQSASGGPAGKELLMDSIEALRDTIRAMVNVSEEFPLHYVGWDALPPVARPGTGNVFIDGATLEFTSANDLPEVSVTTVAPLEPLQQQ